MPPSRPALLPCLAIAAAICALALAGPAAASPGAYRVLVVAGNTPIAPTTLDSLIAAQPGVADVEFFQADTATPSAAFLSGFDEIVSMSDNGYADATTYGNELADFVDAGGVVMQFAYDNWTGAPGGKFAEPQGRWVSGGFRPYLPGNNPNAPSTLGQFDAASPLMAGITALNAKDNTTVTLAPGATRLALWADMREGVAFKGRVVASSANLDENDMPWSGDWGRLVVNAVQVLGRHALTVTKSGSGAGTVVSGPAGISCGTVCAGNYAYVTPVTLTASPDKKSRFTGWNGACSGSGPTCVVNMDSAKGVTATFTKVVGAATFRFKSRSVSINLKSGRGSLRAACSNLATDRCKISLTIEAGAHAARAKLVKLGSVKGSIAGGRTGTLRVRLSQKGLAKLKNAPGGKLKVHVIGSSKNRLGGRTHVNRSLTLRAAGH